MLALIRLVRYTQAVPGSAGCRVAHASRMLAKSSRFRGLLKIVSARRRNQHSGRGLPGRKESPEREIRVDLFSHRRLKPSLQSQHRSECNHGCVVGAEPGFSDKEFDTIFLAGDAQIFPQHAITTHSAAQCQAARFGLLERAQTFLAQDVDDCFLKGGAEIVQRVVPSVSRGSRCGIFKLSWRGPSTFAGEENFCNKKPN